MAIITRVLRRPAPLRPPGNFRVRSPARVKTVRSMVVRRILRNTAGRSAECRRDPRKTMCSALFRDILGIPPIGIPLAAEGQLALCPASGPSIPEGLRPHWATGVRIFQNTLQPPNRQLAIWALG